MPQEIGPLSGMFAQSLPAGFPGPVFGALAKILQIEAADALYFDLQRRGTPDTFVERLLNHLQVHVEASPEDLARVPRSGPVIAVANHPFGLFDGAFLSHYLPKLRPDVKVLANSMLLRFPELAGKIIPVDPFGGVGAKGANVRGLREALRWLKSGGMLVVFPAGEVSSLRVEFPHLDVQDPAWSETVARLLRQSGATALPLYLAGRNSALFQMAGLIHPRLRTALLPHELLNKKRTRLQLRIASPVPPRKIASIPTDAELISHLRWRTYLLGRRTKESPRPFRVGPAIRQKIGPGPRPADLRAELPAVPAVSAGDFDVFLAKGRQMPRVLDEIGRLREITFREVGEGTGKSRDLDEFDSYYTHVVLWHRDKAEIAGAYRLGLLSAILRERGPRGLYTSTLFDYQPGFFASLGPAVELGRSFIRAEYQKGFQPLLLLWKGIGRFVLDHAPAHVLFGAVSISAHYSAASRELMAAVLGRREAGEGLGRLVSPRHPLRARLDVPATCDAEEMESLVAELEADGKPIPVLLRQYLKMGAQLHAFNVDPKFQNCLDGLVVVDLRKTERKLLERYLGPEGTQSFLNQNREGVLAPLYRAV